MKLKSSFLLAALLLLAACSGDIKETLGLSKEAPDEFVVVSRPPLSLPPDFELHPPGTQSAPNPSMESTARDALFNTSEPSKSGAATDKSGLSSSTSAFLKKAGADDAHADIRQQLNEDAATPRTDSTAGSLYEQMVGKDKAEPVVDAAKESERLRTNKQEGKPATEGDTPTAPAESPSVLDKIF